MIMNQKEAAIYLGVSQGTVRNYEKRGILRRADTPRPGTWYHVSDLNKFIPRKLHVAQDTTTEAE